MSTSLPKSEKLKHEKVIKQLFSQGKSVYKYPYKILMLPNEFLEEKEWPQVMFSVSKRNFKHAVDRNRIKRQMREAYRLQKADWLQTLSQKPAYLAIIYVAKEPNASHLVHRKLLKVLNLLAEKYLQTDSEPSS